MPDPSRHVRRIRVEIETVDADGEVEIHTVEGHPNLGVEASLVPHYREQYSRSQGRIVAQEIVSASVRVSAVIPHPAYTVQHLGHEILTITESPGTAS